MKKNIFLLTGLCKVRMRTADADGGYGRRMRTADGQEKRDKKIKKDIENIFKK